ncbi:putative integron gene cassette protein [uncultured Defluviicoccus sp.]|uniref:Putative integron gene cassette protein n=1 Tax=metagenome TaxID=256318 RepID=A0A380TE56_9ZZZZ|nr:putative integron gene cassette protein [uncultured Defluviicoccus sp.]
MSVNGILCLVTTLFAVLTLAACQGARTRSWFGPGCPDPRLGLAFAGQGARDCGVFDDASRGSSRTVGRCAREMVATSQAFRVGQSARGPDGFYCDLAVRRADGSLWAINLWADYSAPVGESGGLYVARCKAIRLSAEPAADRRLFDLEECVFDESAFAEVVATP